MTGETNMRIPISMTLAASLLALAACGEPARDAEVQNQDAANATAAEVMARAPINTPDGKNVGEAIVTETPAGLHIAITGKGMPAGTHGIHLHTVGKCEAPAFESAGPHWNPTSKQHGVQNPQGQHSGDLPNFVVADNGTGILDADIEGARLSEGEGALLDADGAAIVVHADPDDLKTDPSGNSGGRIACGVLTAG